MRGELFRLYLIARFSVVCMCTLNSEIIWDGSLTTAEPFDTC